MNSFKEKVGPGPYAMPQVVGDRVVAASALGVIRSLDKKTDGKFILADEDGTLALLRMTPEKAEVLAKAQVLESIAWSVPALVGTKLYMRDRKNIVALDLSN